MDESNNNIDKVLVDKIVDLMEISCVQWIEVYEVKVKQHSNYPQHIAIIMDGNGRYKKSW